MNAHITKNNNISAGTVARTAVLGLALANQILSACGKPLLPIDSAQLEQWVTAGLTSAAAIWAWWENNSFTKEALAADSYLERNCREPSSSKTTCRTPPTSAVKSTHIMCNSSCIPCGREENCSLK